MLPVSEKKAQPQASSVVAPALIAPESANIKLVISRHYLRLRSGSNAI